MSRFLILTFIGIRPVQEPYELIGQIRRIVYFRYFPLHAYLERGWDLILGYIQFSLSEGRAVSKFSRSGSYNGGSDLRWGEF